MDYFISAAKQAAARKLTHYIFKTKLYGLKVTSKNAESAKHST